MPPLPMHSPMKNQQATSATTAVFSAASWKGKRKVKTQKVKHTPDWKFLASNNYQICVALELFSRD